jgi:antitoxin component of MazEF toxin-antitoxin module
MRKQPGGPDFARNNVVLDQDGGVGLRATRSTGRKYELSELVAQITAKNRHRETDWGRPEGEESW